MPPGWVDCFTCKKAIILLKLKKSTGQTLKTPPPKKKTTNPPTTTKFQKTFAFALRTQVGCLYWGAPCHDLGKWTHPLTKLYISYAKIWIWGQQGRPAIPTVMLHGRRSLAFKMNLYNHLLSLCFLEEYEQTGSLALSKPLCNLILLRRARCFVLFPACTEAKICSPYPGNCWTGKWKLGRAASRKTAHTVFRYKSETNRPTCNRTQHPVFLWKQAKRKQQCNNTALWAEILSLIALIIA